MGNTGNYWANALLNFLLNAAPYTPPATLYIGIFSTLPAKDGSGGTEVADPAGNAVGYARASVATTAASFPATSTESCSNAVTIAFPTPGGIGWGTVTPPTGGIAIFDAAVGGNLMYAGPLTSTVTFTSGVPVQFLLGTLSISQQ